MPSKKPKAMKPAGPEQYVPVNRQSKPHYRKGRGTIKEAVLNAAMQSQAEAVKATMPAAKRIVAALEAHLGNMKRGALQATMGLRMAKELRERGYIDYHTLSGLEAQREAPLGELMKGSYRIEGPDEAEGILRVIIQISKGEGVRVRSGLITAYRFTTVLVAGDALEEGGPEVREAISPLYPVKGKGAVCSIAVALPEAGMPWMLWLKIECMEGSEAAAHPMYRRMKVVAVGATWI